MAHFSAHVDPFDEVLFVPFRVFTCENCVDVSCQILWLCWAAHYVST